MIFFLIHYQDHCPFLIIIRKKKIIRIKSGSLTLRMKRRKNQNFFSPTQFENIKKANGKHVYVSVEEQLQ